MREHSRFLRDGSAALRRNPFPVDGTVAGMLLGVMLIMYAGIWMEKRLPGVAARIALLAPACFLTFMLHLPIYECLPSSMKFGAFSLFTPLLAFTAIVLFYLP